jgi:trimeric autotransporter adhesin
MKEILLSTALLIGTLAVQAQTTVILNSPTQSGSATGQFNTVVGAGNAGASLNMPSLNNTFIGYDAGSGVVSGTANTFVGTSAGQSTTSGSQNTFVGTASGYLSLTSVANTFVGNQSGFNTLSSGNTFVGSCAGRANTLGLNNVFVGACTGGGNAIGSNNTIVGNGAGPAMFNSDNNVFFGYNAGRSDRGWGNTFLGTETDVLASAEPLRNATAIGYGARVAVSNALVLGQGANVGVGTSAPTARLHVVGNVPGESGLRLETLTDQSQPVAATDKFLTVNAEGEVVLGRPRLQIDSPSQWADRVFERGYRLRSLPETERFIKRNGHLPDVPSAETVAKEGVDLAKMNALLLQKVEELTLHVIRLEKRLKGRGMKNVKCKM